MTSTPGDRGRPSTGNRPPQRIEGDDRIDGVLDVLADADCRAIIETASEEALSASELADRHGFALSTAYRKVDLLVEAGLLDERSRVTRQGRHEREFTSRVATIQLDVSPPEGLTLSVAWRDHDVGGEHPYSVAIDPERESGGETNAGP